MNRNRKAEPAPLADQHGLLGFSFNLCSGYKVGPTASTRQALSGHAGLSYRLKEAPDPSSRSLLGRAFRISREHGCQGKIRGLRENGGWGLPLYAKNPGEREPWGWVKRQEAEVGGQQGRRGPFGGTNGGHPPLPPPQSL